MNSAVRQGIARRGGGRSLAEAADKACGYWQVRPGPQSMVIGVVQAEAAQTVNPSIAARMILPVNRDITPTPFMDGQFLLFARLPDHPMAEVYGVFAVATVDFENPARRHFWWEFPVRVKCIEFKRRQLMAGLIVAAGIFENGNPCLSLG
ncbi:hypothetical protein [Mycobacterium sp. 852002-53434_SCH5985345]|uniref:hypothetical protein n=1 Tax=Mycobacterium sp. 852002-53434_SCH5985345 TaxID=1834107 RepID=UPI0012E8D8E2|nr:hypothetical protein [Mycobacterium sp. 852002-53434_SCH5985345]